MIGPLLRASVRFSLCRIAADALRFSAGDIAQALTKMASRIFGTTENIQSTLTVTMVTELLPTRCSEYFPTRQSGLRLFGD